MTELPPMKERRAAYDAWKDAWPNDVWPAHLGPLLVEPEDVEPGSRWRHVYPGGREEIVTVEGVDLNPVWVGGFGIRYKNESDGPHFGAEVAVEGDRFAVVDRGGTVGFAVFARMAREKIS